MPHDRGVGEDYIELNSQVLFNPAWNYSIKKRGADQPKNRCWNWGKKSIYSLKI